MLSKSLEQIIQNYESKVPSKHWKIMQSFLQSYIQAAENSLSQEALSQRVEKLCSLVYEQIKNPYKFEPFHKAIREPFDYYKLGLDMFRPLMDKAKSTLQGLENLEKIDQQIASGENVILYANHQIEPDPQVISLLLEERFPYLAENMIFVAGERVVTDPLAIPLSLGRNLYCVYSKKYFKAYADKLAFMQAHNKKTINIVGRHLSEGGKCIYIAPSGGRDRRDQNGEIQVAKFDPQSVELMYLLGKKAQKKTHYYPLALKTFDILPPPDNLRIALGEPRKTQRSPIHAHFGPELDMENFPIKPGQESLKKKDVRSNYIWHLVKEMYKQFT